VVYLMMEPGSASLHPLFLAWPLVCLVALAALLSRSQRDETESDLRAVELTGDADAMITGLTKLHGLIRQPRRLDAKREQRVTHPSLARRIQAIRQASDHATPEDVETLVIRSAAEEGTIVLLLADRLQWLEGVPPDLDVAPDAYWQHATRTRSIAYTELTELRVDANRPERRNLVAVDRKGEKISIRLQMEDAPRVQRFLDRIDYRLGALPEAAVKNPLLASSGTARWFAVIGALVALIPPVSWALSLASVLVALRPVAPGLLGAGMIGLLASISAWTNGAPLPVGFEEATLIGFGQIVVSVAFFGIGVVRLRAGIEERARDVQAITAILLLAGSIGVLLKLTSFIGPLATMHLHLWVRTGPSALLLLVGGATALVVQRSRLVRVAGLCLGVVLAATFAAGTNTFRARFTNDLLREPVPLVSPNPTAVTAIRSVTLHEMISELELSPSGERFAARVARWNESDYREPPMMFVVEGADSVEHVSAVALRWANDSSVVALTPNDHGLVLRHLPFGAGPAWELQLPDVADPLLFARDGLWSVSSRYWSETGFAELHGTIGSDEVGERRWQVFEQDHEASVAAILVDQEGRTLVLGSTVDTDFLLPGMLVGFSMPPLTTELWVADSARAGSLGRTAMMLTCLEHGASLAGYSCIASSGRFTELWHVNAVEGTVRPAARIPGWRWATGTSDAFVLQQWGSDLLVADVDPLRIWVVAREDLPSDWMTTEDVDPASEAVTPWDLATAYRNSTLAVATGNYDDTIVSLYRISDADESDSN
jgi:hypothetical protein